jgi:hypothetical protein
MIARPIVLQKLRNQSRPAFSRVAGCACRKCPKRLGKLLRVLDRSAHVRGASVKGPRRVDRIGLGGAGSLDQDEIAELVRVVAAPHQFGVQPFEKASRVDLSEKNLFIL